MITPLVALERRATLNLAQESDYEMLSYDVYTFIGLSLYVHASNLREMKNDTHDPQRPEIAG